MLRVLTIAAAFLAVTIGLLLLQPGSAPLSPQDRAAADALPADVSRAETDLVTLQTARTAPAAPRDDSAAALTGSVLASLGAPSPAAPAGATGAQDSDALRDMTASVLAGLGQPQTASGGDELRSLTSSVLAGLNAGAPRTSDPASMETLIVQALAQGQSDDYIDALLNEAAGKGTIQVPAALRTDTGKVDTATLLASLVRKSEGQTAPDVSSQVIAGGDGVEVRVVQRAGKTVQYNFYTVQTGDSLGAIAQKFYGDAGHDSTIFDANRQFLSSPDRIRVGQRLSIPALSAT